VTDLEFAHTVLVVGCEPQEDAPILDLRIRKGVRRHGLKLAVVTARPSALDPNAKLSLRVPPGGEAAFLAELASDLRGEGGSDLARLLRDGGEDIVIVWGERVGADALPPLLEIADLLGLATREGAGVLEIPGTANGRGLREAGVLPDAGPGYAELPFEFAGRSALQMATAAAAGEVTAFFLFEIDPVRALPDRGLWERALEHAGIVVAQASVLTEGIRAHASVVFPAESHAEKEGTVVHPDGRLQRLRIAIAHPDEVRPGWAVIAELARRVDLDLGVSTVAMAFEELVQTVPFYAGITLDEIAGRGVRWPARPQASAFPAAPAAPAASAPPAATATSAATPTNGTFHLGIHRPIWAAADVEVSPALKFLVVHQHAELSPADAHRLGLKSGETVEVASNGTAVKATVAVHSGIPPGTVFLADGLAEDSANLFTDFEVEVRKP
jgi:NADH-quinone oxidoreductase subunit G